MALRGKTLCAGQCSPDGALAPPVGPEDPEPPDVFSVAGFSSLEEPPEAEDSPSEAVPPLLSLSPLSLEEELSLLSLSPLELEGEPVVEVLDVVEVAVVSVASFSAEVSVGGVISGVLLGVTLETLLPPHAASPKPQAMRMRALAPSARGRDRYRALLTR